MSDTPAFVELVDRLRAMLESEYRRGQADAARRIIEAANAEASPLPLSRTDTPFTPSPAATTEAPAFNFGASESPDNGAKRRRAPPGAPDALVQRVLMAQGHEGASSRLIEELAQTDEEKMVSQSGIRFALDRGKAAGKYRNEHGRWFLAVREQEEEKN
jgi:hypothetical protein